MSVVIASLLISGGVYRMNRWLGEPETERVKDRRQSGDSASASQSVTAQQETPIQGRQGAASTRPTFAAKNKATPDKASKPNTKLAEQAALREPLPKTDATAPAPSAPPQNAAGNAEKCGTTNSTISNSIYRNGAVPDLSNYCRSRIDNNLALGEGPNKITLSGQDNTITHNTVADMDVDITKDAQRNFIDSNLVKGHVIPGQIPATTDGNGADMAAIYKAQTRNQYPGAFPNVLWPIANTVLQGTNSGVADELTAFIDEAHGIIAEFRKDGNAQSIKENEKTWETKVYAALTAKLGPRLAQDFDEQELPSDPERHNFEGNNICKLIDTKIATLATFVGQLTAANH